METELLLLFPENKCAPVQTSDFTQDDDSWDEMDIKECLGLVIIENLKENITGIQSMAKMAKETGQESHGC